MPENVWNPRGISICWYARSVSYTHLVDEGIDDTFEDIAELAAQCRFRDCTHTNEPRCAVRQALENGQLSKERFELYRSLHVESRKSADMKAIAKARKALNKTRKR